MKRKLACSIQLCLEELWEVMIAGVRLEVREGDQNTPSTREMECSWVLVTNSCNPSYLGD
jgi:hypothetical protein